MTYSVDLGIIGGTGIYQINEVTIKDEIKIETPFGNPSAPIIIGEIGGRSIAFLARHGQGHVIPPSTLTGSSFICQTS